MTSREGDGVKVVSYTDEELEELWGEYFVAEGGRPDVAVALKWLTEEKGLTKDGALDVIGDWWGPEGPVEEIPIDPLHPEEVHLYRPYRRQVAQHPPAGELPPLKKGTIVYANGWPAIVMESTRRKHNTRMEAVLCEVFGWAHESGSAYRKDIFPAVSMDQWKRDIAKEGHRPEDRYFKGDLMIAEDVMGQVFRIMQDADELPPLAKGTIVYNIIGWPAIVAEATRRKHNTAMEPVFCEVWGWHHEMGSVYRKELIPALSMDQWKNDVRKMNGDPEDRYFKGDLIIADPDQHQLYRIMQAGDSVVLTKEDARRILKVFEIIESGKAIPEMMDLIRDLVPKLQYQVIGAGKKEVTAISKSEIYQLILDETVGRGHGVLTGPKIHPDIPTLGESHSWPYHSSVEHLGFGFFRGKTPSGEYQFDGGGAMRRATDDEGNYVSWTPVVASSAVLSELGYDLGRVERALVELIGGGQ